MGYTVVCHSTDPQWHEERLRGVTATEAAHLMSGKSALELWTRKTGRADPVDLSGNERVWWGSHLEEKILDAYASERYAGRPVMPSGYLLRSEEYPWLLATLDAWTIPPEWGECPLDAKNTASDQENNWADGAPERIYWQLQQQALVTDTPGASVACLIGGSTLAWEDIPRDPADTKRLIQVTEKFWWCVSNDVAPTEVDGLEQTRRALDVIYPHVKADEQMDLGLWSVEADAEYDSICRQLKGVRGDLKRLEEGRREIENRIRREMGNAELALLPHGAMYVRKRIERKGYTVEPTSYTTLRRKVRR